MFFKNVIATALASCLVLTGCNMNSTSTAEAEVDPSLDNDSSFISSNVTACVTGALLGGLAGALLCNSDDKAVCAVGGAAVGCAGAVTANAILNNVRSEYKTKEQQLMATISYVEEDNAKLKDQIANTQKVLEKQQQELANIDKNVADSAMRAEQKKKLIAQADANIEYMKKNALEADKRCAEFEKAKESILADNNAVSSKEADQKALDELNAKIEQNRQYRDDLLACLQEYTGFRNGLATPEGDIA